MVNAKEQTITSCLRSRLRLWFRETDSAFPPRASLLIFHTQAESGAHSRVLQIFATGSICIVNRHRVSPEFIRSCNCIPMVFTSKSPPVQVSRHQGSLSDGCCLFMVIPSTNNIFFGGKCFSLGDFLLSALQFATRDDPALTSTTMKSTKFGH